MAVPQKNLFNFISIVYAQAEWIIISGVFLLMGMSLMLTNQDLLTYLDLNDNVKFSSTQLLSLDSTLQYIICALILTLLCLCSDVLYSMRNHIIPQ